MPTVPLQMSMRSLGILTPRDRSKQYNLAMQAIVLMHDIRTFKGIVNYTAKQGYRADLRQEAVARASAIKQSQRPKKETPEVKLRGSRAKKAEEKVS